jgi:hypothetical protein
MQKIDPKGSMLKNLYNKEKRFFSLDENKITMTYEVAWYPSDTHWASRYVTFQKKQPGEINLF